MKGIRYMALVAACTIITCVNAQQVLTIHYQDGKRYQFPIEDVVRIHQEKVVYDHHTYTLGGVQYPMPVSIMMHTDNGLCWANINVGATNEYDEGLWFDASQIDEVLKAVGPDWRLPTKAEIETLLHAKLQSDGGRQYNATGESNPYLFGASKGNLLQAKGTYEELYDELYNKVGEGSRLPIVSEDYMMVENYPQTDETDNPDNWGYTFFSQLDKTNKGIYKFCYQSKGQHPSIWNASYKECSNDEVSHIRLVTDKKNTADNYTILELKDGTVYQFNSTHINSIKAETLDETAETYTLNGVKFPVLKEVTGMSAKGLKWANMNVGAMNEQDEGCMFTTEQIEEAIAAVGDGWRLPTKEEFEELFAVKFSEAGDGHGLYNIPGGTSITHRPDESASSGESILHYIHSQYSDAQLPLIMEKPSRENPERFYLWSQLDNNDGKIYLLSCLYGTYSAYREPSKYNYKGHIRLVKD